MIKDFTTYINEGLFDRNQSEFNIAKTNRGVKQVYIPKTRDELEKYIELDIEQAKKEGTYPNVNLSNIDVSEVVKLKELSYLFSNSDEGFDINPDISEWNIRCIDYRFFYDNQNIKSFVIPNSVEIIDVHAFSNCKCLTSITLPDTLAVIGSSAFYNCDRLTSIDIPNGVERIHRGAFSRCKSLTSIVIPSSVTFIDILAFDDCDGMTSIDVASDNPSYRSEDGVLFDKNMENFVRYPCGKKDVSYSIPDNVSYLSDWSFSGCKNLRSIIIPDGVETIGNNVFYECSSLTFINIPRSVNKIMGDSCFSYCTSLTYATVPKGFSKNCKFQDKVKPFPPWCKVKEI